MDLHVKEDICLPANPSMFWQIQMWKRWARREAEDKLIRTQTLNAVRTEKQIRCILHRRRSCLFSVL